MEKSSALFVCILVTCSVLTVHGRSVEVKIDDQEPVGVENPAETVKGTRKVTYQFDEVKVKIDDQEPVGVEIHVKAGKITGLCQACREAVKLVRKALGPNATEESVNTKLNAACDKYRFIKSMCRCFVKEHLGELVKKITSNDDERSICVSTGACEPKELLDLVFHGSNKYPRIEINEYP